jgi:hypothetical protein
MTEPKTESAPFTVTRKATGLLPVSALVVPAADLLAFAQAAVDNGAEFITVNRDRDGRIVGVAFEAELGPVVV